MSALQPYRKKNADWDELVGVGGFQLEGKNLATHRMYAPKRKSIVVDKQNIFIIPSSGSGLNNISEIGQVGELDQQLGDGLVWGEANQNNNYVAVLGDATTDFQEAISWEFPTITNDQFKLSEYHGVTGQSGLVIYETLDYQGEVTRLYSMSKEESFEDGMDSQLSDAFLELSDEYTSEFLGCLYVNKDSFNIEGFSAILRVLGRIKDINSLSARIWFLGLTISDKSSIIRDASALALSEINEEKALPLIVMAIENEPIPSLKNDMQMLVNEWGM